MCAERELREEAKKVHVFSAFDFLSSYLWQRGAMLALVEGRSGQRELLPLAYLLERECSFLILSKSS